LSAGCQSAPVTTELDDAVRLQQVLRHQKVGIVTNHTAYNTAGRHIVDVVAELEDVQLVALFGPEHGIRGAEEAGATVASEQDPAKKVPIYSLYGATRKPTAKMLQNIDVLVFDIQDIGARFYTYIYTMALAMEAAAEQGIKFVVLDRPNPITGIHVEGNVLDPEFVTFVGLYPLPVRHGMTVGELATLIDNEGWLKKSVHADLTVIPLQHWSRHEWFDQTGLPFRQPSPNMPDLATATVYPGLCLIEGTNVSEGRGTDQPFQLFGAPWVDAKKLCPRLNELELPGVHFDPASFTPASIPQVANHPKYQGRTCFGARVRVIDRNIFQPYWTGIQIVNVLHTLYPDSLTWRTTSFDRLCGTDGIRKAIIAGQNLGALRRNWQPDLAQFEKTRRKYLLYP